MTDLTHSDAVGNDFLNSKVDHILVEIVEASETINTEDPLKSKKSTITFKVMQGIHQNKTIRAWYNATLNSKKSDGSTKVGGIWKLRLLALACGIHDEYKLKTFNASMMIRKQLYISTEKRPSSKYFSVIDEKSIEEYQGEILGMEKKEIENVGKSEKPPAESNPVSKDDLPF